MDDKRLRRAKALRWFVTVLVAALLVQFVIGMVTNLYVQFPDSGGNVWKWGITHSTTLVAHVLLGSVLVLVSFTVLVVACQMWPVRSILALSIVGFLITLFTWMSGESFMSDGQHNASSFLMAAGFAGMLVVYLLVHHVLTKLIHNSKIQQL